MEAEVVVGFASVLMAMLWVEALWWTHVSVV